jgi:hypothetical protein
VYERVMQQGCALHLVLEDMVVSDAESIGRVEDLVQFSQLRHPSLTQAILE